jgi:uncharacterized damage-inducible protein DinB
MAVIPNTPYSSHLEGRDPIVSMRETIPALAARVEGWTPEQFERPIAPGKWTVRQVLVHLFQTEMALGTRARMAVTTQNFIAQSFDQDKWLGREQFVSGADAVQAFVALASLNLGLYSSLTEADRQITLTHDEYGPMTVDWIIYQEAGHQVHHLKQLKALSA